MYQFISVQVAVTWLRLLIETHTSQLMALGSGNILDNFGTCLGIIEFRTEHLKSLSKYIIFMFLSFIFLIILIRNL